MPSCSTGSTAYSDIDNVPDRLRWCRYRLGLMQKKVANLLAPYNQFLYRGQGRQIRALRESTELSVPQFSKSPGVYATTVRKWEADRVRISNVLG